MDTVTAIVLALVSLAAAAYVHSILPAFINTRKKVLIVRSILIMVGLAFGFVCSRYMMETMQKVLVFFAAFGLVHVPAAIILFIKGKRGERQS